MAPNVNEVASGEWSLTNELWPGFLHSIVGMDCCNVAGELSCSDDVPDGFVDWA